MAYEHKPFATELVTSEQLWAYTKLLRLYFSPKFYGLDNIVAAKPALLVGNHTLYGIIDVPLLLAQIYKDKDILVRSLADHAHYDVPLWRNLLDKIGGVEGTRENCSQLMQQGQHVLVFPGGAREVSKRKGEQYQLTWKRRTGFCRMAIQHKYDIIPFAAVGPDDAFDILVDGEDILQSPLGGLLKKAGLLEKDSVIRGGDLLMPLTRGIGPTMLPKPERFYFSIGERIDVSQYAGKAEDESVLFELRDRVAFAIQDQIGEMLSVREQDYDKGFIRRVLNRL